MTNGLVSLLAEAQTEEECLWFVTQDLLQSLPTDLSKAAWAAALPHWFNAEVLSALHPELAPKAEQLYSQLQGLAFVETFPERGHNIHEATRHLILNHLWQKKRRCIIAR